MKNINSLFVYQYQYNSYFNHKANSASDCANATSAAINHWGLKMDLSYIPSFKDTVKVVVEEEENLCPEFT